MWKIQHATANRSIALYLIRRNVVFFSFFIRLPLTRLSPPRHRTAVVQFITQTHVRFSLFIFTNTSGPRSLT